MHKIQLLNQEPVVAGQMDQPMKPLVGARQRAGITAQKGTVIFDHAAQDADFLIGRMARGQPRGQTLKLGPHGVKLSQLVVIERGHHQAAPVTRQHPLGLQPLQRLAHRGARHAETLGQFGFHKTVARFEIGAFDGIKDERIGVFLHGPFSSFAARD